MASKRRVSVTTAESGTKRQCQAVSKALLASEALPQECKAMLSGMSVGAMSTCQEDRHPFETSIIEMVNATLSGIEDATIKRNAEMEQKVANAGAEKMGRAATQKSAAAELKAKADAATEKKAACDESDAALTTANAALADAISKEKKGNLEVKKVADKKEMLNEFRTSTFTPLKDGSRSSLSKKESAEVVKQITTISAKLDMEKPMVMAVIDALKVAPSDRSTFLATAITQTEQKMDGVSASLDEQLAAAEPAKNEREAAVAAAEAVKATAVATVASCVAAREEAEAAKHAAQNKMKAADLACKHFFSDMKKMMDDFDNSKEALEGFQSTVMVAFKELETLAHPPPPVVEAESGATGETAAPVPAEAWADA